MERGRGLLGSYEQNPDFAAGKFCKLVVNRAAKKIVNRKISG
jgi:hypothetical protein